MSGLEHRGTAALETARLRLRRFAPADAADCFASYKGDEETYRLLSESASTRAEVDAWLASADAAYAAPDTYYWAIERREDGRIVGEVFVDDYGERNRWCELDWIVGRAFRDRGYASEAAGAAMAYLFETGFHRVQAKCAAENAASERVMQKLGMKREGVLRGAFRGKDGRYRDVTVYAALAPEERRGAVTLRHFTRGDIPALRAELWRDASEDELLRMIADWNTLTHDGKYFEMFAVVRGGAVAGTASLYEHTASTVSLGAEIFESERGKGCAFEALQLLMAHAREKGFRIAQDQVRADNAASIRLHEKLGFETDGYVYRNQKGREVVLYWKAL
ncbi:MAG: GNAT family N-acetyltransferase [Oscillospiraceae bacterium]|nr:GNAT family N-acetyltransferase [Oscillospiraceae bacterium]